MASTRPSAVSSVLAEFWPVTMLPDRVANGRVSLAPCLQIAPYFLNFASIENGTMPPAPMSSSSVSVVPVNCNTQHVMSNNATCVDSGEQPVAAYSAEPGDHDSRCKQTSDLHAA